MNTMLHSDWAAVTVSEWSSGLWVAVTDSLCRDVSKRQLWFQLGVCDRNWSTWPLALVLSSSWGGLGFSLRHDGWFQSADIYLADFQILTSRLLLSALFKSADGCKMYKKLLRGHKYHLKTSISVLSLCQAFYCLTYFTFLYFYYLIPFFRLSVCLFVCCNKSSSVWRLAGPEPTEGWSRSPSPGEPRSLTEVSV